MHAFMYVCLIEQFYTDTTANLFQLVEGNITDARVSVNNGQNKQSLATEFATALHRRISSGFMLLN